MCLRNYSQACVVIASLTVLQFSTSYGKAVSELNSTTDISAGAKQANPSNPGRGGRPTTLSAFLITAGIVLALVLAFVIYKFRLWQCRQCRKEDNTSPTTVAGPMPYEQQYSDETENSPRVNEEPPEYDIPKYERESNHSFSTISLSENNYIPVTDEPPPPTYYDVTRSSVNGDPSIIYSSSQQDTPKQFTSS